MAISASMVRELREKTGAAMMDCKKALEATGGSMDEAIDHLRKAGLKTAAKKEGRDTKEGRVAARIADDGRSGSIVAVACETDFVANTEDFGTLMSDLSAIALEGDLPTEGGATALLTSSHSTGATVEEHLKQVIGKLGENIQVADAARFSTSDGFVGMYVHHNHRIGALAAIRTTADRDRATGLLTRLCQHIAATQPAYLTRDDVPADELERERQVHRESDELSKKPEDIREKIIDGKIAKFYAERCLVEQPWTFDDKLTVAKAVEAELGQGSAVEFFSLQRV